MKISTIYLKTFILSIAIIFAACGDDDGDSPTPTPNNPNNPINPVPPVNPPPPPPPPAPVEGPVEGTWFTSSAADMGHLATNNDSLRFTVTTSNRYTLIYYKKDRTSTEFAGTITKGQTLFNYTNGAKIWNIQLFVQTINGQPFPGGWKGIYTFDGEDRLLLNLEPTAAGVTDHPTADEGLGSGESGNETIYKFNRQ